MDNLHLTESVVAAFLASIRGLVFVAQIGFCHLAYVVIHGYMAMSRPLLMRLFGVAVVVAVQLAMVQ